MAASLLTAVMLGGAGCTGEGGADAPKDELEILAGTLNQPNHSVAQGLAKMLVDRGIVKRMNAITTKGGRANAEFVARGEPVVAYKEKGSDYWIEESYGSVGKPDQQGSKGENSRRFPPSLGFTDEIALARLGAPVKLRRLVSLWSGYGHLVVSEEIGRQIDRLIQERYPEKKPSLSHLVELCTGDGPMATSRRRLKIYIGPDGSTSYLAGKAIFGAVKMSEEDFLPRPEGGGSVRREPRSHNEAIDALLKNPGPELEQIDVAFLVAGIPSDAVHRAVDGHCVLLNIEPPEPTAGVDPFRGMDFGKPGEPKVVIPANAYDTDSGIATFQTKNLLVAHADLPRQQAMQIVEALFTPHRGRSGQEVLLGYHEVAEKFDEEISLKDWEQRDQSPIAYHPGAEDFWAKERRPGKDILWLYAGPMGGTSYRLGEEIAQVLRTAPVPIEARVVSTKGSQDSIARLQDKPEQKAMALVHNDAATASYSEANANAKKLRLLSFLYPESAHLLFSVPEEGRCRCLRDGEVDEPSSLKDLIPLLTNNPRLFGYSDDDFAFERQQKILDFYRTLSQGPALSAPAAGRQTLSRRLSLVQIQEGLIEGDIRAALVMSASPMRLITECLQPDHPRLGRTRRRSASRGETCPKCELKVPGPHAIRVLPLDVPERAQPGASPVPGSLRGLIKRHPLLKAEAIPPHTYVGAQRDEVSTVSVEVVLICREDLGLQAGISGVLGALYDDEVRLRAVVKEVDLRDPLAASVKDPSIPLHPEARSFYEEKGVLQPIPRPKTWLTFQNLLYALFNVFCLILGILAPADWRQVMQRFFLRFVLTKEKRKNALEEELRAIYFKDEVPPQAKVEQIERFMEKVLHEWGARNLNHTQAENLDLLARDYLERLDKTLDWRDRVSRPGPGPKEAATVL